MSDSIPLTTDTIPASPVWLTDTIQYYLDHRKLIQNENQKSKDIEYGQRLYALIYSKVALKDPMLAVLMFQQELLPAKQAIQDDDQAIFSNKLDMTTDLNTIVNTAENMFNEGASITQADVHRLTFLLLFLTAIPFADDLNSVVVSHIQNAFIDMTQNAFHCGPHRDPKHWEKVISIDMPYLFNTANNGADHHNQSAVERIKTAYQDFDQATGMLNSCNKMLGNDANTSVADEKTQLGGYSKMADEWTGFARAVNRAGAAR